MQESRLANFSNRIWEVNGSENGAIGKRPFTNALNSVWQGNDNEEGKTAKGVSAYTLNSGSDNR
jgi:hypothetical protein